MSTMRAEEYLLGAEKSKRRVFSRLDFWMPTSCGKTMSVIFDSAV